MKGLLIGLALLTMTSGAFADSTYDEETGNFYQFYEFGGKTKVYGRNSRTGARWKTEIEEDGDMSGTDSKGRKWDYDADSGNYTRKCGILSCD